MNQKIGTGLALAIIAVVAGAVAFFVWSSKEPASQTQLPAQKNISQKVNQVAGWQTYRNDKYKFEIKYPKDWKIQQDTNSSAIVGFTPASIDKFPTCKKYADDLKKNGDTNAEFFARTLYCIISVNVGSNPSQLPIKDYLKKVYNPQNDPDVTADINSLLVEKRNNLETVKAKKYLFVMADQSFAGGKETPAALPAWPYPAQYTDQFIVSFGKQIIFVTNSVDDERNKSTSTFNGMIDSFKGILLED